MKSGATKLKVLANVTFSKMFTLYLAEQKFMLRIYYQTLSWLNTHLLDEGIIGNWIALLDQYNEEIDHVPVMRTQTVTAKNHQICLTTHGLFPNGKRKIASHFKLQEQERLVASLP